MKRGTPYDDKQGEKQADGNDSIELHSGEATLVLDEVTMDTNGGGSVSPVYVGVGTTLNLILRGANSLQGVPGGPGIWVVPGGVLNIYAEDGGSLTATGGIGAAGIGGDDMASSDCGTVNIYGGTVNATGGNQAAGIGGGRDGTGGTVNIYGGNVTAKGTNGGAGIGGGATGAGGSYTQYGGTVNATGGAGAGDTSGSGGGAGVGGGGGSTGGESGAITIYGGTLVATGGAGGGGAGMGGGGGAYITPGGAGEAITVFGGDITATGGAGGTDGTNAGGGGAGIGGGGGGGYITSAGTGGTLAADQIYIQNGVSPAATGGAGGTGGGVTGGAGAGVGNGGGGTSGANGTTGTAVTPAGSATPPNGSTLSNVRLNGLPMVADPDNPTFLTLELPVGHGMTLSNMLISYAASPGASVTDTLGGGVISSGASLDFHRTLRLSRFQFYGLTVKDFSGGNIVQYQLHIVSGPEIVGQPQNATAAPGGSASFTVNAPTATNGYSWWMVELDGLMKEMATWTPPAGVGVSGENTATLTLTGLPESMSGYGFVCFVSNADGTRVSGVGVLTVQNPAPAQAAETGEQTTPTGGSPQTGDGSAPGLWALLGAAALGGLAVLAASSRKKAINK